MVYYLYQTKEKARKGLAYHAKQEPNKKWRLVKRKTGPNKGMYEVRTTLGGSTRTQQLKAIQMQGERLYFRGPTRKALRRKKETGMLGQNQILPAFLRGY